MITEKQQKLYDLAKAEMLYNNLWIRGKNDN